MKNREVKKAEWKLKRAFSETDSPNSYTRAELIELIKPQRVFIQKKLSKEYFETFGENYEGDIVEDTILDLKSLNALKRLANI